MKFSQFLSENKNLQDEIVKEIMAEVNKGIGFLPNPSEMTDRDDDVSEDPEQPVSGNENFDGDEILEISDSDLEAE